MLIHVVMVLQLISGTIIWSARVALPLYALELGAQPFMVGVLAASFSALPTLFSVLVGKLSDRFGCRWLLVVAAILAALAISLPFFDPRLYAIFVAAAIVGLSNGAFDISGLSLVGVLSKPDSVARNFSNYSLIGGASNFLGPLFAGISIDSWGHGVTCLYLALFSLVPVGILLISGAALPKGVPKSQSTSSDVRGILADSNVRRVLVIGSLLQTSRDLFKFYFPVYAHSNELSASAIGIVLALTGAAETLVRLILPNLIRWSHETKLLRDAFYIGAIGLLLIPFFKSVIVLSLIAIFFGLGMGCAAPIVAILMFANAPASRAGEAMGLKQTLNHVARLLCPIVAGSIASGAGLSAMFWIFGLVLGGAGILSRPRQNHQ